MYQHNLKWNLVQDLISDSQVHFRLYAMSALDFFLQQYIENFELV